MAFHSGDTDLLFLNNNKQKKTRQSSVTAKSYTTVMQSLSPEIILTSEYRFEYYPPTIFI